MERVEAAGGRVINWDGYRVLGVLATSRSIGKFTSTVITTSFIICYMQDLLLLMLQEKIYYN